MWPVSWGHQCCESPAAFGCVVVMCVVGWGRSDGLVLSPWCLGVVLVMSL